MKIVDDDGQVIAEGQMLSLQSGDILVFQTKRHLNMDSRTRVREELQRVFPDNKVAVLEEGDEISILHRVEVSV